MKKRTAAPSAPNTKSPISRAMEEVLRSSLSHREAASQLGLSFDQVRRRRCSLGVKSALVSPAAAAARELAKKGADVEHDVELPKPEFGSLALSVVNRGDWHMYGVVADTHLCCKEERLAELHTQYDLFASEGITTVFHAGNIVDGYIPRINGGSVRESSIDGQCQYVVDNYPKRPGIKTYFITGDDHEGWWQKEGFNFGGYLEFLALRQGREDLKYIGHVESDVELKNRVTGQSTIIKIQHPGGGSAYSRSYTGQKQVEAYEGGEKPHILIQGHYHVSNYMQERNVHVISMPGFQDQTIFARKKRLRMEVGGAIISFKTNPDDGTITRFRPEFNRYFTRSYYRPYLKSDTKIIQGHLVLTA